MRLAPLSRALLPTALCAAAVLTAAGPAAALASAPLPAGPAASADAGLLDRIDALRAEGVPAHLADLLEDALALTAGAPTPSTDDAPDLPAADLAASGASVLDLSSAPSLLTDTVAGAEQLALAEEAQAAVADLREALEELFAGTPSAAAEPTAPLGPLESGAVGSIGSLESTETIGPDALTGSALAEAIAGALGQTGSAQAPAAPGSAPSSAAGLEALGISSLLDAVGGGALPLA